MSRSSKDIYDAILEAQKLQVRGEAATDEEEGRPDQPTPRDVPAVTTEEDEEGDSDRGHLPTPVSGVQAVPESEEEAEDEVATADEPIDDATPVEGIDREAELEGDVSEEEPKKRRLSSELTTEEVLQLEDDEILDVDEDEQEPGEEQVAAADIVAEAADVEPDDTHDDDELDAADIVEASDDDVEDHEDGIPTAEIAGEEDDTKSAESVSEEDEAANIVAENEEAETTEIVADDTSAEDDETAVDEVAAAEPPTADIVEEDDDEELMEADVFGDEDIFDDEDIDDEDIEEEELDDDLEQSFDDMFDDLGDMLFSEEEEEEANLHQAPTEETDTVYSQPQAQPSAEKEPDDEGYGILKDAFEFASSDSAPEKDKPRDGSRLRLASASYQAVPQEDEPSRDDVEEAPDVVEEENIGASRPSDAYDIVKDAFEFASSDGGPQSKNKDASTLRLASAAYQAVPDDAVDDEESAEEDSRSSEEQEREALEALAAQKERSGPRPIVGPAVRKKKKGFFERLFNNEE